MKGRETDGRETLDRGSRVLATKLLQSSARVFTFTPSCGHEPWYTGHTAGTLHQMNATRAHHGSRAANDTLVALIGQLRGGWIEILS